MSLTQSDIKCTKRTLIVREGKMTEETKQFKLMIPLEMKRWLAIEAAKNMRSQNAEILIAIRERMERLEKEKGAAQS